jgi:hypothetical protein
MPGLIALNPEEHAVVTRQVAELESNNRKVLAD